MGQDIIVENNKFINNENDLDLSAGDNITVKKNEFGNKVYVDKRATNTTFIENSFYGVDEEIIPEKVTDLKVASKTSDSVTLSWTNQDTTTGLVGYVIYKDGKEIGQVPYNLNTYTVSDLRINTNYGLKVASKYSNGESSKAVSINVKTEKK